MKTKSLSLQERYAEGTCLKRHLGLTLAVALGATCWRDTSIDTAGTEFLTADPLGLKWDVVRSQAL